MKEKFIIGIDLGGTNLKIAALNLEYKIICKKMLDTREFMGKREDLISAIVNSIEKITGSSKLKNKNLLGVGLGAPGPIDSKQGIVHFLPNIPGWRKVNLKKILEKKMKLPVFLDNDANLMSLAEHRLGAARGFRNVACLTLGTGIGGGLIIDNNLYRGVNFVAGEIGHIPINEKGPLCNCGGIACLEAYVGNNRILKEARRQFRRDVSLEELSVLAKGKNKKALGVWDNMGRRLGIALVGVVNLLNLDAIVIGGGVANVGKILFDRIRETIRSQAMSVQAKHVRLFKARLGNNAGLIGAAILVRENC